MVALRSIAAENNVEWIYKSFPEVGNERWTYNWGWSVYSHEQNSCWQISGSAVCAWCIENVLLVIPHVTLDSRERNTFHESLQHKQTHTKKKVYLLKHLITPYRFVIPPLHSHLALGIMTWLHLLFPAVSVTILLNWWWAELICQSNSFCREDSKTTEEKN